MQNVQQEYHALITVACQEYRFDTGEASFGDNHPVARLQVRLSRQAPFNVLTRYFSCSIIPSATGKRDIH
jgi:hypothetical protein